MPFQWFGHPLRSVYPKQLSITGVYFTNAINSFFHAYGTVTPIRITLMKYFFGTLQKYRSFSERT